MKVFFKISQDSQENNRARDLFNDFKKRPIKKALVQVFHCEFCEFFKDTCSVEHLRTVASNKSMWLHLN